MGPKILLSFLLLSAIILSCCSAASDSRKEQLAQVFREVLEKNHLDRQAIPKEFLPHVDFLRNMDMFHEKTKIAHREKAAKDVVDTVVCEACGGVVTLLIDALNNGVPLEDLEDLAARGCALFNIVDDSVCDTIVYMFGPYFEYVIKDLGPNATPELICGLMLNSACLDEAAYAYVNDWTVDLPDTVKPPYVAPTPPSEGSPTVKVLHFTDVHLDLTYLPGSAVDCTLPCCCMNNTGLANPDQIPAPYWGTYGNCDMPLYTLEATMKQISEEFGGQFDYALFTGDAPAHDVWLQTKESNNAHVEAIINLFKQYFPDINLYITLGNHEGYPVNVFPTDLTDPMFEGSWLYDGVGDMIADYLTPDALQQFRIDGSYSVHPFQGFKLINLNNNYGASQNLLTYSNFKDPNGQLAWLITQLQDAEDNGDMVHIITHHPSTSVTDGWEREFAKIAIRYENNIRAIFVGHTHADNYHIWMNDENVPSFVTYINPAYTSNVDRASEFRIFTIDGGYEGASYQVIDVDTYFTDIEQFTDPEVPPVYQLLYNTREAYGMNSLLAPDWVDLLNRALVDDALFENIVRFEEQNWNWALPENRTAYLCGKLYNTDECLLDNLL